jgi:RNA polymerase subunit RPABC4/transcription elongation factor Spt4
METDNKEVKTLTRPCPHCNTKIDVFDEVCPACGKTSKPGTLISIAAIIYGHRSFIFVLVVLVVAWIILDKLIK